MLQLFSSGDGVNWIPRAQLENPYSYIASLCVWKGKLVVFQGFPAGVLSTSADGETWSDAAPVGFDFQGSVALCEHSDGNLYAAFHQPDSALDAIYIYVCSTSDGVTWSAPVYTGKYWGGPGSTYIGDRSIVSFNGLLWMAYTANDTSNDVLVTSSSDGVNWSGDYQTGHQGYSASITVFGGELWIAYITDNGTCTLLIINSTDGIHWSGDIQTNQQAGATIRTFTSWKPLRPHR